MALYHVFSEVENRRTGVPMAGVQVRVKYDDTDTEAPIYADQNGTAFTPENYCVTDADGMYSFYVNPGEYKLEFLVGSEVIKTISDFRPAEVGPAGPANSTYATTAELESADTANVSAILAETGKAGTFTTREYADFTAQVAADTGKVNYIRSVFNPTQVWVRTSILTAGAAQVGTAAGATVETELSAKANALGIAATATHLGTFTGGLIPANKSTKEALQVLSDAVQNTSGNAATKVNATAVGVAATDANMGTTPGTILSDNGTAKQWFQESEAAIEGVGTYERPVIAAPAIRTSRDKLSDRPDIRDWDGIDLTGANDCASIIQAAFNESASSSLLLNIPAGTIALDSPITWPGMLSFQGAGIPGISPVGTKFHLTHTGKGFVANGRTGTRNGRGFVTYRDHAAITGGWTPTEHDYDFEALSTDDFTLSDVLLQNPTRGINIGDNGLNVGGGGRHNLKRVMMQPLLQGINVDCTYDVDRWWGVQIWPFWNRSATVQAWMQNNLESIILKRVDNAQFFGLFSIWHRDGLVIDRFAGAGTGAPAGTVSKLQLIGGNIETGRRAIWVKEDADGASIDCHGMHFHCGTSGTVDPLIQIDADNTKIKIMPARFTNVVNGMVEINGTGNRMDMFAPEADSFNTGGAGAKAFEVAVGNTLAIIGDLDIPATGTGGVARFGGAGTIRGGEQLDVLNQNLIGSTVRNTSKAGASSTGVTTIESVQGTTPANGDRLTRHITYGYNASNTQREALIKDVTMVTATDAAEDFKVTWSTRYGGTFAQRLGMGAGVFVGASAADMGAGTLNVQTRIYVGGGAVITTRRGGWTAATGTATRTTFATGTVTLPQLAERVKGLIDDLISHGLIGS